MWERILQLTNKLRPSRRPWYSFLVLSMIGFLYLLISLTLDTKPRQVVQLRQVAQQQQPQLQTTGKAFTNFSAIAREVDAILKLKYSTRQLPYLPPSRANSSEILPICSGGRTLKTAEALPRFTLIISLFDVRSEVEALLYLRHHFERIDDGITDDVIVTANVDLPESMKDAIEELVDLCMDCRLFFLAGTIYEHRNFATKFARKPYLVFVDARVIPGKNWLPSLLETVKGDEYRVTSPQVRLRYSDGSAESVGISVNEITWDLGVVRGYVNKEKLRRAQLSDHRFVNQSVISTEVFAINKEYFTDLRGFDTFPNITGGEHVSFSFKVLNCRGNIVTALCSDVYLTIPNNSRSTYGHTKNDLVSSNTDFYNPTFQAPASNVSVYINANSKVLLDGYSIKYFTCVLRQSNKFSSQHVTTRSPMIRRNIGDKRGGVAVKQSSYNYRQIQAKYSVMANQLKKWLQHWKCGVSNFRYILADRQPGMLSPSKFATAYGFIRSIDGMYALGVPDNSSDSESSGPGPDKLGTWPNLILTRNSSLWLGPFSFTNGAFIYRHVWCLTLTPENQLNLQRCFKGTVAQLFMYSNNLIKPAGVMDKCACSQKSNDVSMRLSMNPCVENSTSVINEFRMDVRFTPQCIR